VSVIGIGVDAIEIDRVARALSRTPALADRLYTTAEQDHCVARTGRRRAACFAARFAAKEAVAKALGTGVVGFTFCDVEIVNGDDGAPAGVLGDAARAVADHLGTVAVATAVAES
jgi:holo-[acyl-carrier protein] synthase